MTPLELQSPGACCVAGQLTVDALTYNDGEPLTERQIWHIAEDAKKIARRVIALAVRADLKRVDPG